ncbi:hypothetical protein AVEN_156977-1 [Araneus ventricosus]|uniref:Uncharacterized protein n=1 Tax=Araneus ventricosus TaxID=182803 RepID=A0A4Y2HL01_ARAVE|nr:hypothetical protein AVEN_156977-1 [Araneus ventricosus]
MFNVHSICVKHTFKACYSVFNSSAKGVSIDCSNMARYACCRFRQSLYAYTIGTILQEFPQPELIGIQVRRTRRPGSRKSSRNYPIMFSKAYLYIGPFRDTDLTKNVPQEEAQRDKIRYRSAALASETDGRWPLCIENTTCFDK